jgi:enoyl-CoA hydratase/carnithine racemase
MQEIDTGTQELLCQIDGHVAVITLNKPHKKNALGDILTPALRQTLLILSDHDEVGCIMITGAGDAFCSGGDVSEMGSGQKPRAKNKSLSKEQKIRNLLIAQETLTQRIFEHPKITVAAISGAAAGAGLSIALACDLRLISDQAFITTAFARVGLTGDYGASWFLPRLIGLSKAKELFYSSDRVRADEGKELGLFHEVYPHESFQENALSYCKAIAAGPSLAFSRMKENLNTGLNQSLNESLALEARNMVESMGSSESKEAIAAFMEKRPAVFK